MNEQVQEPISLETEALVEAEQFEQMMHNLATDEQRGII